MSAHRAERVDDLVERGVPEAEARKQAAREFGNLTMHAERSREVWIAPFVTGAWQDARYALRALRRQPIVSLSAILVLALGIGLVSALFIVFNAEVLRPWPVPDPSSVAIVRARPAPDDEYASMSFAEYRYLREHTQTLEHLASNMRGSGPITDGVTTRDVQSNFVTANYFRTLRIGMLAGRDFAPDDEDYRAPRAVAIVSERLWRESFGSDPSLVGRTVRIRDQPFVVIGVAAPGFHDVQGSVGVDLWMPLPSIALLVPGQDFDNPRGVGSSAIGRLRPGVTREEAQAELDVLSRQFRSAAPSGATGAPGTTTGHGVIVTDTRPVFAQPSVVKQQIPAMGMMFAALLLVLLVACANAGNLLLARALARRREIAIRLSLGASRRRVVRQLLTESAFLSIAAGSLALALATAVPQVALRLSKSDMTPPGYLATDAMVVAFVFGVAALACLLSGLAPALRLTRPNLANAAGNRHGSDAGGSRLRTTLLAAQVAFTTVLLVAAGLLTRAADHAFSLDTGFAIDDVRKVTVELPRDISTEGRAAKFRELREVVTTMGLAEVAFCDIAPFDGSGMILPFTLPSGNRERTHSFHTRGVSSRYFDVLGIPLLAGRTISEEPGRFEVVVSESVARLFAGGEAIGQRLFSGGDGKPSAPRGQTSQLAGGAPPETPAQGYEIVGVVRDVPLRTIDDAGPAVYWRASEQAQSIVARATSPVVLERLQAAVRSVQPGAFVVARGLRESLGDSLNAVVVGGRVAWAIGVLALTLATIGAFGVFAYLVEERRREIGVRMALGARASAVVTLVLGGASRPILAGLAAGLGLALAGSPLLRGVLYGLSPFDPIAYLEIAAILTIAALAATWIPARRATRTEPAIVLRNE